MTKRKSRSGTVWTDADYEAAGYGRLTLRLREETLAALEALAARWECTRTAAVERLVQEAH